LSYLNKAVADKTHKIGEHAQDDHVDVACTGNSKFFSFKKLAGKKQKISIKQRNISKAITRSQ
jgi:hypothetical protein